MLLVASDFDGTLYVNDINIINKNIEYINKLRENNHLFAIITGRGLSIIELLKKYNISYDFLICENGAIIYDNKDNILYSCYLEQDDINSTIEIIKKYNLKFIIDTGDKYITDLNQKFSNVASIFLDRKTINDVNEMLKIVKENTNTYSYISPNWINIVNMNVNKKKTLEKLETILENKYKICPIGDAINDVEMISFFDGGVMKNHEKELDDLPNKNYDTLADYIKELI